MSADQRPTPAAQAGPAAPDLDALAGRVDAALAAVTALEAPARAVAEELKDALSALERAGLAAVITGLRADPRGRELLHELVDAPEVRTLFLLHGLIRPPDLAAQAAAAFADLVARGVEGELVGVEGTTATVRLPGAKGCSAGELRDGVKAALLRAVPGLRAVEVEAAAPARAPGARPAPTFIALSTLTSRTGGWVEGPALAALRPGRLDRCDLGEDTAVVLSIDGALGAFVNACPRQGEPLEAGRLDLADRSITCPGHGLVFDALSGACVTVPGLALTPVPVRVEGDRLRLRTPPTRESPAAPAPRAGTWAGASL